MRAIVFDPDAARALADRLRADGFAARIERERYAGEDDDEDHPWAVRTDAPAAMVELLLDEDDGWLDLEEPEATAAAPPPVRLPASPRRVKRPDLG